MKRHFGPTRLACAVVLVVLPLAAAACGDDDTSPMTGSSQQQRQVEQAFLTGMVHHHETAIEMAAIARQRGADAFIKRLAAAIITAQEGEIARMKSIHRRLLGRELRPDPRAHDALGLSAEQAGMTHTEHTTEMLQEADPFDRAFVDEMVPHHRGAIAMANVVLDHTRDRALRRLANGIIEMQRREIDEMQEFRAREFGGPVPEGAEHGGSTETSTGEEHEAGH